MLVEGQVEGGGAHGARLRLDRGVPDRPGDRLPDEHDACGRSGSCGPRTCPRSRCSLVEVPQPRSPFGIKGVGEIGLVPTAPAVAAALHAVDGEWRTTLPMRKRRLCRRSGDPSHRECNPNGRERGPTPFACGFRWPVTQNCNSNGGGGVVRWGWRGVAEEEAGAGAAAADIIGVVERARVEAQTAAADATSSFSFIASSMAVRSSSTGCDDRASRADAGSDATGAVHGVPRGVDRSPRVAHRRR